MPDYYQCIIREGEERRKKLMTNTKCISTRLHKEQASLIEQLARDRNILVADWYKEALQEKANKQLKKGNPHAKEVRLR